MDCALCMIRHSFRLARSPGIGRPDAGICNNLVPDGNILVTKAVWIREGFSSLIVEQKLPLALNQRISLDTRLYVSLTFCQV
jgi:hypothetical protein